MVSVYSYRLRVLQVCNLLGEKTNLGVNSDTKSMQNVGETCTVTSLTDFSTGFQTNEIQINNHTLQWD